MTKNKLPKAWRNAIIAAAIENCTSEHEGTAMEAYARLRQAVDEGNDFDDIGITPWEPYEDHDAASLLSIIDDRADLLTDLLESIGAPDLLAALKGFPGLNCDTEDVIKWMHGAQAAIAKAEAGQ